MDPVFVCDARGADGGGVWEVDGGVGGVETVKVDERRKRKEVTSEG
jgi:hypothetical protein